MAALAFASRARDRPPARSRRARDRLRRPVHRAADARGGRRPLRRHRRRGQRDARDQPERRAGPHQCPRRRRQPGPGSRASGGRQPHDLAGRGDHALPVRGLPSQEPCRRRRRARQREAALAVAVPRWQRTDRLPRRRRYLPQRPVLAGASRGRARQRLPPQDRRGRRDRAKPSGFSCDAHERQRSHAGTGGPGERDLDGLARQPADERARLAHRARHPRRRAAGPARRAAAGSDPGDDDHSRRRCRLCGCGEAGVRCRRRPGADRTARRLCAWNRRNAGCELRRRQVGGPRPRLGRAQTDRAAARRTVRGHRAARPGCRVARRRHRRAHPSHRRPLRAPRAARRVRTRAGIHAPPRERPPRHRQDRHPGQRPAQAGRTRPGRVARSCNRTPRRVPRSSRARPRRSSRWPRRSPAPTTSAGTAPATPTAWRARTSRSRAASAPSATSTTRWARSGRTRRRGPWSACSRRSQQGSGSHFDPALVKAFLELAPELGRGARPEQLDDVDLDSLPPLFEEEAEDVSPGSRAPFGTRS